MGRFLVLVAIVVALAWLLRRALSRAERGGARERPAEPGANGPSELVQCAHCGVHLPRAEARAAGDALYCSDEHARRGPGAPS